MSLPKGEAGSSMSGFFFRPHLMNLLLDFFFFFFFKYLVMFCKHARRPLPQMGQAHGGSLFPLLLPLPLPPFPPISLSLVSFSALLFIFIIYFFYFWGGKVTLLAAHLRNALFSMTSMTSM